MDDSPNGWTLNSTSGKAYANSANYSTNAAATFYARWTVNNYDTTVTVTMNATTTTTVSVTLNGVTQNRTTTGDLTFSIPYGKSVTPSVQFTAVSGKTYNLAWTTRGTTVTSAATAVTTTAFTKGTGTETYTAILTEMYVMSL